MKRKIFLINKFRHQILFWAIGLMRRVFADGPVDWGSIQGRVLPKTHKMVLDVALLDQG